MSQVMIETIIIIAVGFVGSILPLLPGPPIIWLGALYYGWRTGWIEVGWPSLTLLLILAIIGGTADLWMGLLGANKGGASGWATVASFVGGLLGFVFGALFGGVGAMPGAIIGAVGGIVLVEYNRHRDWNKVLRASGGYLVGSLLASVAEVIIALVMIGVFVAAVNV
jgi:uncharacterized protein